jgi:hypothetical protein
LWYVVKNGCKFRLKIQGNIEEQSMDVKGLVMPPRTQSFKQVVDWYCESYLFHENHKNSKHQKPNLKQIPNYTSVI